MGHAVVKGRILGYGFVQKPVYGVQNPDNLLLNIPTSGGTVAFRPDLSVGGGIVEGVFRPRWELQYRRWTEGTQTGEEDFDEEAFVNEWAIRARPIESVMVSYGRENLQWGPAYLLSPTNPFFRDNGRSNPKQEVGGMDFLRFVWTPSYEWSFSFVVNTDEGRQQLVSPFEKTWAVKVDYVGYRWYASALVSWKDEQEGRPVFGAYAGANVNDALLVYAEGSAQRGTMGLYVEQDESSPFGLSFQRSGTNGSGWHSLALLGISYTTRWGPTFVAEYAYNEAGYSEEEAERFFELVRRAGIAFRQSGPAKTLARKVLYRALDPEIRLLRRHYLMLQYQQRDIGRRLDAVLRYTMNLDDGSSRINPILEYELSDHWMLFLVGSKTFGNQLWGLWSPASAEETEYRRLGDYSFWLGVEYAF